MASEYTASPARNVLTGTAARYLLLAANIGIGFLLMPFTIQQLGKDEYGLWMLVASMTAYFQLLDLGYGNGLVRHIAEADARHDDGAINQVLSTFVIVYAAIGAIVLAASATLAVFVLPNFPRLAASQVETARWLVMVLGLRIAVGFPMTVFGAVTMARQRFALNGSVAIASALLVALVTWLVLSAGYGLRVLVPATVSINLLSYVAYAAIARRVFPAMQIRLGHFSRARIREITSFSFYLFLIDISAHIGFNVDNLIIGAAIGTSAVAVYAVAARLADYQRQLSNQFNNLLFPVVVSLRARGDSARLRATLLEGTRLAVGLVTGVTIPLVAFGGPFVGLWMGPGFEDSLLPLYLLAVAGIVLVGQGPIGNILLAGGRHRLVAFVSLGESLANLVISIVLVGRFGMAGAAAGTAIAVAGANLGVLVPAASRLLGVPLRQLAGEAVLPALIGGVPAAIVAAVLRNAVPETVAGVVARGAIVAFVYAIAFGFMGLRRVERRRYVDFLRHQFREDRARRQQPAA